MFVRAMAMILLIAMFHYVAGYRLMYSLGILYAKEEAKECLVEKKANTQKLTFSTADFNSLSWSDNNKEFSLNNEMYDVATIEKSGSKFIVTVYSDENETSWISSLHNFEKELFHPDQSTKGNKSAEDVMSSFQKECTTTSEFKITVFASDGQVQSNAAIMQQSQQDIDNIWHPPATC